MPIMQAFSGVLLILLALCADAMIGNVQEKTLKQFSASNSEMVHNYYHIHKMIPDSVLT